MEPDEVGGNAPILETPVEYNSPDELKDNPAWAPFLETLPESLHNQIRPVLRDWDKNINNKFQEIHSNYADYKPFQEQGITPDVLANAVSLMQQIEENPRDIWDKMKEYYQFEVEANAAVAEQGSPDSGDEEDYTRDSRYDELEPLVRTMAEQLLADQQSRQDATDDAYVDEIVADLHTKYGNFDENYVYAITSVNGGDLEAAVQQYQQTVESAMTERNRPSSPVVLSASGSLPAQGLDVRALGSKDTKSLVMDILAQAAQNR